jgi:hypothetical protein
LLQFGEELEHPDRLGIVDLMRRWVDGTQRSEETAVATNDRYGNVAFQPIDGRRVMVAVFWAFISVIYHDEMVTLPNLMADRRLNLELAASLQPEINIVENGASQPAAVGDPGDCGKPPSCR